MVPYLERKEGSSSGRRTKLLMDRRFRSCTPRHLTTINNTTLLPPFLPLLLPLPPLTALLFSICSFHLVLHAFLFIFPLLSLPCPDGLRWDSNWQPSDHCDALSVKISSLSCKMGSFLFYFLIRHKLADHVLSLLLSLDLFKTPNRSKKIWQATLALLILHF